MFLIPGELAPFMHLSLEFGAPVWIGKRTGCARSVIDVMHRDGVHLDGANKELG